MKERIEALLADIQALKCQKEQEIEEARVRLLGKKGEITRLFEEFRTIDKEQKKEFGQKLNQLKNAAVAKIEELKAGNLEFESAAGQTEAALRELDMPCLNWFMEHCLDSFRLNLDELEKSEDTDEEVPDPDFYRDGTMTKKAILRTVKELKPGDRIHLEYKPFIGKLRVYDTEYLKLVIDLANSRYFSLYASNADYNSLMEDVAEDLFGSMEIYIFCEETCSEISCRLKQVRVLQIIDKKERCS